MALPILLVLLNSRLLDWIFRRGSAHHANDYYAANKQFIAGLPIRVPDASGARELDELGRRLHALAADLARERHGFLEWLARTLGSPLGRVPGERDLARFETSTASEVVDALVRRRARLGVDPRERSVRDLVEREHRSSVARLLPLAGELDEARAEADRLIYELYELPGAMRELVEAEYLRRPCSAAE